MKRLSTVTLAMVAFADVMAITVLAQNAHFMRCDSSVAGNGSLSVSFRIAGLGAGASDTITAHTTATSIWGCLNGGQQCPNAANKFTSSDDLNATLHVTAEHNGAP